jgi:hypothetical protein
MASMRKLAMELLSRSGSGPVLQPTNVYGQDPDLPIGYGEGEIITFRRCCNVNNVCARGW